jgi:peptide/nickel transport system substrate-binding protein
MICMLCTELPDLDNGGAVLEQTSQGKDGIAVTYTIQPDATWGDGTPVTTKDVMLTWEIGRDAQAGVTAQELYTRILSIDVKDDKTFTLHWDRVTFDYNAIGDFQLLPDHLERAVFEENPAEYRNRTTYETDPTNPGLYFGPYRVSDMTRGSHIVLEINPTWWGEKPQFKRIVVKAIENTAALEANLLSGEIDMIAGELGFTLDQALAFEKRHGDRFNVVYQPGLFYEHLDLQLDNPILQDTKVRQALLYGIDRKTISHQLFEDKQPVADSNISPLNDSYDPDVPKYAYDPARAQQLLQEAGWTPGKDGILQNGSGEKLTLELMTTAGNRTRELVEQVLQSQWKQIGVDIKIHNEPPRVFFGDILHQRKHTGMAMFAWVSPPDSVPRSTLHSEMIPSEANGWSGQNIGAYKNPQMDKLLDALELELDPAKRKPMWVELQQIYATELPALPLYFQADAFVLPKWLDNLKPTGHLNASTLWVEQWQNTEQ